MRRRSSRPAAVVLVIGLLFAADAAAAEDTSVTLGSNHGGAPVEAHMYVVLVK